MEKSSARQWDGLSVCLLFVLIQVAAVRLVTTNWAPYLYFAELAAAYGTALGLALGFSRYKRRIVIWFVVDYTLTVLPLEFADSVKGNLLLEDKLLHVGGTLITSFDQFILRQPVKDSLFFVAAVSLTFWILSLCAGYWLVRHRNVLVAILPSGIGILFIQIYDNFKSSTSWWLAVFIVIALLLLGRHYYLHQQNDWKKQRVFISEDSWFNIFGSLFMTAAFAVIIAWVIPTSLSSVKTATGTWNHLTQSIRSRLSNAVSSLNAPYGPASGSVYGDTLALGHSISQSDAQVFYVQVLSSPDFNVRYYWRGRAYDSYNNGQWKDSPASRVDFKPENTNLDIPDVVGRQEGDFKITFRLPPQIQLYAPSQPVWINQPSSILATAINSDSSKEYDLLMWEAKSPIETGDQYEVHSEIANPTIDAMRASSTDYPQWITSHYLEIPGNIRSEIQSLAEQVTVGKNDPYSKASAITNYLRTDLQYATNLPIPPKNQDPILWVLFDYKKAFCTYYASAEVLMLRSVGVPARLAVGFAQGRFQNGTYIVRERDTHAWPEVYFSGIGWVEFEPTVSQAPLIRSEAVSQPAVGVEHPSVPSAKIAGMADTNLGTIRGRAGTLIRPSFPWTQVIVAFVLVALLIFVFYRYRPLYQFPFYISSTLERNSLTVPAWIKNWQRWNQLSPIERYFASINLSLGWLGRSQAMDVTASQRAALLRELMPSASTHIEVLNAELESALFTPRPANMSRARRASLQIVLHTLRSIFMKIWGTIYGSDVYSG